MSLPFFLEGCHGFIESNQKEKKKAHIVFTYLYCTVQCILDICAGTWISVTASAAPRKACHLLRTLPKMRRFTWATTYNEDFLLYPSDSYLGLTPIPLTRWQLGAKSPDGHGQNDHLAERI